MMKRVLPGTLRLRLTVLIVVSTSVILALSGLALYGTLRNRIESGASQEMSVTLSALQAHLTEVQATADIARNAEMWVDQLHGHPNLELAIFDTAGSRLLGTPGFVPYAPTLADRMAHTQSGFMPAKSTLRYLATTVALDGPTGPSVRVVVQYDGANDRALLRAYAYTIVLIEVLGVMLAAGLAYGIAMLGLSPLRRLVARAEEMSTSRLAHPLPELDTAGELKELGHAFNGMLARLDDSFTRLSQFSSNLAHDMRTPLTNLLAEAQVALSKPRTAAEYRSVIESSIDEYQRLSRMIEDMLFLARSDSAKSHLTVRSLDAVQEAGRVAGYYEPMAEDAMVAIEVRGA